MGYARLGLYIIGLLVVVLAAWVFLTQTDIGRAVPGGVALALILLLVGIGVMASAKSINDSRVTRRVAHDGAFGGPRTYAAPPPTASTYERRTDYASPPATTYDPAAPAGETVVEERRYD